MWIEERMQQTRVMWLVRGFFHWSKESSKPGFIPINWPSDFGLAACLINFVRLQPHHRSGLIASVGAWERILGAKVELGCAPHQP